MGIARPASRCCLEHLREFQLAFLPLIMSFDPSWSSVLPDSTRCARIGRASFHQRSARIKARAERLLRQQPLRSALLQRSLHQNVALNPDLIRPAACAASLARHAELINEPDCRISGEMRRTRSISKAPEKFKRQISQTRVGYRILR
jgi:hypothetical protein